MSLDEPSADLQSAADLHIAHAIAMLTTMASTGLGRAEMLHVAMLALGMLLAEADNGGSEEVRRFVTTTLGELAEQLPSTFLSERIAIHMPVVGRA